MADSEENNSPNTPNSPDYSQAVAAINASRSEIVSRVVDTMYADPFWLERFGERGRIHAEQDVHYHLDNLSRAIRFALLESPVHHYHWLQNVLTHRGVCTRYLKHTLDQLGSLLAEVLPESWPVIQPYVEAGYRGLEYSHPVCRALAAQEQAIGQAIADVLVIHPQAPTTDMERSAWLFARQEEGLCYLSYLLDAVEKDEPRIFLEHVEWTFDDRPRHGVPGSVLEEELSVLRNAIEQRAEGDGSQPFVQILLAIPRLRRSTSDTPAP